jgi:hypothetical protein
MIESLRLEMSTMKILVGCQQIEKAQSCYEVKNNLNLVILKILNSIFKYQPNKYEFNLCALTV